jgi:uncharacterized SAM-binding protein YcdF (DUF218 family)
LSWAAIIGLILLSLAAGAWLGGWLADRCPQRAALELTHHPGAVGVALIPLLGSTGACGWRQSACWLRRRAALQRPSGGRCALRACPPCCSARQTPGPCGLAASEPHSLGQTAGRLSATATAGSLLGAFLPVLWLIPAFGTRWSFHLLALLLLAVTAVSGWRGP